MKKVSHNPRAYIALDEAIELSGLERPVFEKYTQDSDNGVVIYSHEGTDYIDRFDLGRILYNSNNGSEKGTSGIEIDRYFTDGKTDPFDSVGEYETRPIQIIDFKTGEVKFDMPDAEIPVSWNENSGKIAASKYFFKPEKQEWKERIPGGYEKSPKQLFSRISKFFGNWGMKLGYFESEEQRQIFEDELNHIQINQMAAFNSPVNFNAGLFEMYGIPGTRGMRYARDPETGEVSRVEEGCYTRPQTHACFIKGPEDNLESLLTHVATEGSLFADGSGIGHDLSNIRADGELISSGGTATGPMSFFKGFDAFAGTVKSGGKTRRAARMTTLKVNHPDIMEFVRGKVKEDHKALTLIKAGYEPGFEGDAYSGVAFQSTNLSVRGNDDFFEQVDRKGNIQLRYVKSGEVAEEISADRILKETAFGSWRIGDPGMQYESKIDEMNTVKNSGEIRSSNPCSEYMFLNDTSCNLNSLNLIKFSDKKGNFDVKSFNYVTKIMTIAADIANDAASYPHPDIAELSPEFRTIGVGYANLGALLMRKGIPYDSNEGRAIAASITAIMHGEVFKTSALLAKGISPFIHYELNKEPMMEVMKKHMEAVDDIGNREDLYGKDFDISSVVGLEKLIDSGRSSMAEAIRLGMEYGYRNAQGTVLAPTGTIAFLMGCDTTGVEPGIGLLTKKKLAGGGHMELPIEEVGNALNNLGYNENEIGEIEEYIKENMAIEGAPHLDEKHYAAFDTSFAPIKDGKTGRTIDFEGHVKMLGATQPFISGAISKTCNLPPWATVKEMYDGYILGHKLGLKALAVFRDDSKPTAPLEFGLGRNLAEPKWGDKVDLPTQRNGIESEFSIGGSPQMHLLISEYEDGTPGQIAFLGFKVGSALQSLLAQAGILASKSLKHGTPLERIIESWEGHSSDVVSGMVQGDPWIKQASSPLDYAARFLKLQYLGDLNVANNQEGLDITKLRGYESGAFEVNERRGLDDWNFEDVINDYKWGGFVEKKDKVSAEKKEGKQVSSGNKGNEKGRLCGHCGSLMRQPKPNCFECPNCFEDTGGCG